MGFAKGQIVYGKVVGKFQVEKVELGKITGTEIVVVRQIGPKGEIDTKKMKFPPDCLQLEEPKKA